MRIIKPNSPVPETVKASEAVPRSGHEPLSSAFEGEIRKEVEQLSKEFSARIETVTRALQAVMDRPASPPVDFEKERLQIIQEIHKEIEQLSKDFSARIDALAAGSASTPVDEEKQRQRIAAEVQKELGMFSRDFLSRIETIQQSLREQIDKLRQQIESPAPVVPDPEQERQRIVGEIHKELGPFSKDFLSRVETVQQSLMGQMEKLQKQIESRPSDTESRFLERLTAMNHSLQEQIEKLRRQVHEEHSRPVPVVTDLSAQREQLVADVRQELSQSVQAEFQKLIEKISAEEAARAPSETPKRPLSRLENFKLLWEERLASLASPGQTSDTASPDNANPLSFFFFIAA